MRDFKQKITEFHYGKNNLLFSCLLFFPSVFYFFGISIKNFLYRIKVLKEKKVWADVICVGNLTTGGVGKTPLVIEIGKYLSLNGKRVVVLSRGYGGSLDKNVVHLVKTYNKILIDNPELTGDEVNLISRELEDCAVIISKDRFKGANYASEELNADIVLMDDGFSNRKLYKDFNILLFDCEKLTGNGFVLPYGPLREPLFELKRANKVVFVDKTGKLNPKLEKFKKRLKISYLTCRMETKEVINPKTGEILEKNSDIIAFSGIGSPKQFYDKLSEYSIKETITFDDHFKYSKDAVDKILNTAEKRNVQKIVTTEKDMVKLLEFEGSEKFYVLKLKPKIDFSKLFDQK